MHVCQVWAIFYSLSTLHMFSGGELWAANEPARDRSGVCKTTTQRSKGCIAFDLTLIILRCSAFNPTIDKLPDGAVFCLFFPIIPWPGFCFVLWYGLGRPVITSEIGNWSVFVLLGWRFVFGIIIKRAGREPHRRMPSRLWE